MSTSHHVDISTCIFNWGQTAQASVSVGFVVADSVGLDIVGLMQKLSTRKILLLAFQSIGVVYGDVGTSPLYVYASTFVLNQTDSSGNTINALEDDILGTLSLIIYTITLIPLIKYCFIVLKANDEGQGEQTSSRRPQLQ